MNKQYNNWQDAIKYLTTDKYDGDLKKINRLKCLPWVGKNYDSTRIFVLGASHYEWIKQDEEGYQDMITSMASKEFTREVVAGHGVISDESPTNAFGNFRKCMLNEKESSLEARGELWSSVLFHNLLQEPMIDSKRTVVTKDNSFCAWEVFKKIVPIFRPEICIAWGVDVLDDWGDKKKYAEFNNTYKWEKEVGGSYPRKALITIEGHETPICVIHHPSRNFSHTKWREYLLSQHKDKLQNIISS